jgi:GNAT superfamily N-acetyltransferase
VTTVRPAVREDVPSLVSLLGELFAQEADFAPDRARQERGIRMILEDPARGRILVLEEEGRVTGMVSLLFTVSTAEGGGAAWLEDLVVEEGRRGRGAGALLLDHAVRWAREQGLTRITLLTDRANEGALRFYARRGFTPSSMVPLRLSLR